MKQSIITNYMGYCLVCGSPNVELHHGIFGTAGRAKSEALGIIMPLCPRHHNSSNDSVHMHHGMKMLSKQLSQMAYERNWYREHSAYGSREEDPARDAFRQLFGESYL